MSLSEARSRLPAGDPVGVALGALRDAVAALDERLDGIEQRLDGIEHSTAALGTAAGALVTQLGPAALLARTFKEGGYRAVRRLRSERDK